MAFGTDGMIKQALTDLGEDKVGVMQTPKLGYAANWPTPAMPPNPFLS